MPTDIHTNRPATLRRLIVRVSSQTLAFSTTDANANVQYQTYLVKNGMSMAANLREALRTEPMLQADYGRVVVMVDAPVLLIPVDQFREDEQEELYRHAITSRESAVVMHYVLTDTNAVAVFGVGKDLCTVLTDRFGTVRFIPVTAPVWRHMHQRSFTGPRQKLYAYFHDGHMEMFAFKQNRFTFCNAFDVQAPDDALYYMLSVWKLLGMTAEQDELHLAGLLPDGEQLLEQARTFVKRVYHILPAGEFNRAQVTQVKGIPYDIVVYYMKKA